jgi:hypothetical protein
MTGYVTACTVCGYMAGTWPPERPEFASTWRVVP